MQDKHHAEFLQIILPLVDSLLITQPHMDRAATVDELLQVVSRKDMKLSVIADPWEAYCHAQEVADASDVICVTGSLFLVGEILQHVHASHSPMIRSVGL